MPEKPLEDHAPAHADIRYEKSDARIGPIALFGVGMIVTGLLLHLTMALLFAEFQKIETRDNLASNPLPPLAARERLQLPRDMSKIPPPLLQTTEIHDMDRLRQFEDSQLNSYGWVDANAGKVRIPIAEAMKLLANLETARTRELRRAATQKKDASP